MEEQEIWLPVVGWEGLYEVSSLGRVKSLPGKKGGRDKTGRILRPGKTRFGYLGVMFDFEGRSKWVTVHRIVATAFIPNTNTLPCINHKDFNKRNNTESNLEWCTYKHNSRHALDARRIRSGRGHPKAVSVEITSQRKSGTKA